MQFLRYPILVLLTLVSLVGCQQNNAVLPSTASPALVIPTNRSTPIPSLTSTFTPIPTITATSLSKPTATVTLTPLPTMPGDEIRSKFDQLYRYNNGCKLPCWWGITPGKTTWGDARNFLMQFEEHSEVREDHTSPLTKNPLEFSHATFVFPGPNYPFNRYGTQVDFEIQDGVVVAIKLMGDVSRWMFDLKKLYREYGDPNRILIVPKDCSQDPNNCLADVFYMYDEEGFLSQSFAYIAEINDTTISLCMTEDDSGAITSWAPGMNIDLKTSNKNEPKFITLEQAIQAQISELFSRDTNSRNHETCFDTPR